jgi:hypothetical protein
VAFSSFGHFDLNKDFPRKGERERKRKVRERERKGIGNVGRYIYLEGLSDKEKEKRME